MDIDDKIDRYLKMLYEAKEYTMFASDLYGDDFYMKNVPHMIDRTMIERGLVSVEKEVRMLTAFGMEVSQIGGWKLYQQKKSESEMTEIISREELQSLTKKQLELSIREMQVNFTQIKNWWLILLITTIGSAIWVHYSNHFFKK